MHQDSSAAKFNVRQKFWQGWDSNGISVCMAATSEFLLHQNAHLPEQYQETARMTSKRSLEIFVLTKDRGDEDAERAGQDHS